jgi:hypothetical protein
VVINVMREPGAVHIDRQLRFVEHLLEQNIHIAGEAVEVCASTWVIHGVIPIDGSVIVAEFDTYRDARVLLDHIADRRAVHASDTVVGPPRHSEFALVGP